MNIMKTTPAFFILSLFTASLLLHFVAIGYPREAVFDEVHFGKFVSGYLTGQYFFDIHPPLGKLMIAGMGKSTGFTPGFDFQTIGEQYPNGQYIWLRLLPAIFGSLLIPLIYFLTLRLSGSTGAARLAALFTVCENALLIQSKFILIDSFLLFFGFAALYFFLQSRIFFNEGRWGIWSCVAAAVFAGFACSIKWTAISFWGLMLLFGAWNMLKKIIAVYGCRRSRKEFLDIFNAYLLLVVIPPIIYIALFAVHFRLLPEKGPGNAYMSNRFQQSQASGFPAHNFLANFYELNQEMFRANQRIAATHEYSSKWYTWPLMLRPVYYWNKDAAVNGTVRHAKIYLIGNPFVWWLSTITVIYFFISNVVKGLRYLVMRLKYGRRTKITDTKDAQPRAFTVLFLSTAYCINLFPFIFIGRVMFLYHYLTALCIAIMIAAITCASRSRVGRVVRSTLVAGVIAGFLIISPITYGLFLNASWPRYVFWLKSWI